jgi:hypothetical protein
MQLTERQIQYGFDHFFPEDTRPKSLVEVAEYEGQEHLTINCTQLAESYGAKDKSGILNEWIDLFTERPDAFTTLRFGTRMPQALFDAVCQQTRLVELEVKWGAYSDLSSLEALSNLALLSLGSGATVESIEPLSTLASLRGLAIENYKKVQDYSALERLTKLESLSVCGDGLGPQYIKVESLEFLRNMLQLRYLKLLTIRLTSTDYRPVLELVNLEHLSLRSHRDVKKLYGELVGLPRLKWGLLTERPENYLS